jgi:signal transduction histidine kinase
MKNTMNIKRIFSILLGICLHSISAQNSDSLKLLLKTAKEDTNKINTLLAICSLRSTTDSEMTVYATSAMALSKKQAYQKGIIGAHTWLGAACLGLANPDQALGHFSKALQVLLKFPDPKMTAFIYNNIGNAYTIKSDHPAALSWYQRSLRLYEELGNEKGEANACINMASVYSYTKNNEKARGYISRAAATYTRLKDTVQIIKAESKLGSIAYDLYQYDTALVHFERALKITEGLKDKSLAAFSYAGIGNIYFENEKTDKALIYHEKALAATPKSGNDYYRANLLINVGRDYAYLNKFGQSLSLLKESVALSQKSGAKKTTSEAYYHLAEVYELKKDYKNAMEYCFQYAALNDKLYSEEMASRINDLNTKYENEKKEKSIALLNAKLSDKQKTQELLQAKVAEKNAIILSVIGGTILVLISGFLFYSRQRLRQKNKYQQELNEQQKNTAGTIIQMLENERNRIARELHDGIGTYISTLKINLQVLEQNAADEKLVPYKNSTELLDKTSTELRKITKGLSNESLQEKGLAPALQELVSSIPSSDSMQVRFLTDKTNHRFDPLLETNYYRVAQELINNSLKHSQATKISLQLIDHDNDLLLMLEDNGVGFDQTKNSEGMGLKNIKNRIDFLGGTFKIESVPEKGSTFIIEVPKKAA